MAGILESLAWMIPPQVADVVSIAMARPLQERYLNEANVLFGRDADLPRTLLVKAPLTLAMAWGDNEIGKKSKALQWVGRALVYGAYGYIAYRNLKLGGRRIL